MTLASELRKSEAAFTKTISSGAEPVHEIKSFSRLIPLLRHRAQCAEDEHEDEDEDEDEDEGRVRKGSLERGRPG